MAAEKPSSKGQAWFCTTGLPSDVVIEVDDITFHLHKFPLMSKSKMLHELIKQQEANPTSLATAALRTKSQEDENYDAQGEEIREEDEEEQLYCHITLPEFPGGAEAFEAAAKFCYGVKIELSCINVAALRCAGEILEMTEDYSQDNLVSKTERFFSRSVLKSLKESIKTLKSCEELVPLAETLGIVQRCIDSVAAKASSTDPSLFGWPVNEPTTSPAAGAGGSSSYERNSRRKGSSRGDRTTGGADLWFEELAHLSLPLFKRLILAMRARDMNPEIVENCLICYARRYIPGISRSSRKLSSSSIPSENEQKELLETIVANLPEENCTRSSTAVALFFGLLRISNILSTSDSCQCTLEKKIGAQLEQACLDDLLMPSYSYLKETLYDIDCIERILAYFLHSLEQREEQNRCGTVASSSLMLVGKLIDGYLSEIASDANLKPEKFCQLAVSLPEQARLFDDGLYRAVDVFLKAHPWITEADRERVCGVMDCQKLTLEACTHAAQNERLPLRAVVQVLFFEQLQLRHAIAGTLIAADATPSKTERPASLWAALQDEEVAVDEEGGEAAVGRGGIGTWRVAVRDNQVMRLDMDSMRTRVHELERECTTVRRAIEKIDKVGVDVGPGGGWRGSLTKKFGCKFKTQVCDSHEPNIVEARKGRTHRQYPTSR